MAKQNNTVSSSGTVAVPVKNYKTPKSASERISDKIYWFFRCIIVLNVVVIFLPQLNPARLSEMINKNLSLFSCGVSYSSVIANCGRALRMGWVSEDNFRMLSLFSAFIVLGAVLAAAGGCMSLGNNKLKKRGLLFTAAGGALELGSLFGLYQVYLQFKQSQRPERVLPMLPDTYLLFIILGGALLLLSVLNFILVPKGKKGDVISIEPKFQLFLMMLPVIALAFVFSYLPLYGWRYAFFDYKSGETLSMDKFIGFKWFTSLFQNNATKKDIIRVMQNTLAMSGLGILTSWIPLAFAVFLSEIKNMRFRRFVQTFTTIPNFISWVLVYAIAIAIFSTDGFINTFINSLGGSSDTNYLMSSSHVWLKMLAWGTWKGVGWSAIIYIAAISGIDQNLYEAATVDGAGRFQKMRYITIPDLIPTYCVLLLMSIANILSNGMEQYLVFSNAMNMSDIQVLDLYVYNLGIENGLIPLSTVIGMVKSIISVILLFSANGISKLVRGESIV